MPDHPDWKAPADDGQVLIWPDGASLIEQTFSNNRRLCGDRATLVQGVPLSELRQNARAWVGHHEPQCPLILTGHQTELYHPGVWAKHALTNALAARTSGQACYLAVDTDAPKHLSLRWPGGAAPVTDDANLAGAQWCGQLAAPTPAHLAMLLDRFSTDSANWSFEPMLPEVLASLQRLSLEEPNLSTALVNAMHELDWSLGLRHHAMLASPVWASPAFLVFAHHLLARAEEFAARYNGALADYRRQSGTKSTMRPMPDLFVGSQSTEAPFWLDDLSTGRRSRPSVFPTPAGFMLELVNGSEFVLDRSADAFDGAGALSKWLVANNHRLAPRALTLTMFVRLFLADQFVHGIGGARYDRVTDQIIRQLFGIEAPHLSVTTATMFFPEAAGRTRECLSCLREQGHRLRHAVLGSAKSKFVEQIEALPRRSPARAELFASIHRQRRVALLTDPHLARWQLDFAGAEARDAQDQAIFDRELFYGVQSRVRLVDMIDRYKRQLPGNTA